MKIIINGEFPVGSQYNAIKHGMTGTRPYRVWQNMHRRCREKNNKEYKRYGGRGISVCEEWKSFEVFWEDMKEGYEEHLTLDRIDNNKNYTKDNCRWATLEEQGNNKRNNVLLSYKGETKTAAQWSRDLGINANIIYRRVKRGWSDERTLTQKVRVTK